MTANERLEVMGMVAGLREELLRQMGQFERDKVQAEDNRARGAIKHQAEQIAGLQDALLAATADLSAQIAGLVGRVDEHDVALGEMQAEMVELAARVNLCEGRITRLEARP